MKAVVELTKQERESLAKVRDHIFSLIKDIPYQEKWDINERTSGYAHYKFKVKPSQKMIDAIGRMPTTSEIIMIVDGGFCHFGASCGECNGVYSGRVNTDQKVRQSVGE